jgi:hypothetical protein
LIAQETSSGHVEIVPVIHAHRRRDDPNSVTIKTDKDGKTRLRGSIEVKTLGGWIIAIITFVVLAWREIQHAYNDTHEQHWQQPAPAPTPPPALPAPAIPVPQLSPPQIPPPTHP